MCLQWCNGKRKGTGLILAGNINPLLGWVRKNIWHQTWSYLLWQLFVSSLCDRKAVESRFFTYIVLYKALIQVGITRHPTIQYYHNTSVMIWWYCNFEHFVWDILSIAITYIMICDLFWLQIISSKLNFVSICFYPVK